MNSMNIRFQAWRALNLALLFNLWSKLTLLFLTQCSRRKAHSLKIAATRYDVDDILVRHVPVTKVCGTIVVRAWLVAGL